MSSKGLEEIKLSLYGKDITKINFNVDVPEYDKIYVSKDGNDSTGDGSNLNPFETINKALTQNKLDGGNKTIIVKSGKYFEYDLVIDSDVIIIGEESVVDAINNKLFEIDANVSIFNISFVNATIAIDHKSGELHINNSEFSNNQKAIVSNDKLNISCSKFNNNTLICLEINGETLIKNCIFDSNDIGDVVKIMNKTTIDNSSFINGGAIHSGAYEVLIKNTVFNGNDIAIIASGNIEIYNNTFNSDSISLTQANAKIKGNKNTTINIENSNITNVIITFLNGATVIVNNGTIQLNATVTDDMGNHVNGGKITFKQNNLIIGEADVVGGFSTINDTFIKGNYTITGSFDSDIDAEINDALLRVDVDYYWFIGKTGYETLKEAIDAAQIDDVIEGVSGTYTIPKLAIGHRYFSLEPWEIIKSLTITSLGDEPVTLQGDNNQLFFIDIGSELTLKNIILTGGGRNSDDGGAIEAMYGTNLTVINCTFSDNHAENGGAIYSLGGNVLIKDSIFDNNFALVGGAIDVIGHYSEIVTIDNATFTNNFAFYGGAVYNGGGNIEIDRSVFYNNAANIGGALMMRDGFISVNNTDFILNIASSEEENFTSQGGAAHNYLGDLYFTNVKSINNSADKGGALELENGLYGDITWTTFENCIFINNQAKNGGAMYLGDVYDPYVNITNSKFELNKAIDNAAIANNFGHVTIKNTEFNKNNASSLINVAGDYINGEGFSPDQTFYAELNILNSTFNDNEVETSIITNSWSIITIADSKFNGEHTLIINNGNLTLNTNKANNTKANIIINNATLLLNSNEFDTPIINKKDILTPTSIIILNNETKSAAIGAIYEISAIIYDDNRNIIESGNLQFIINNETKQAEYIDNTFRLNFTVVSGTVIINAVYNGTGLKDLLIFKGSIIGKLSPDLNVAADNISVSDDLNIQISINPNAIGNISIKINNASYSDTIKNGFANFKITNLTYGNYSIEVIYDGSDEYAPANKIIEVAVFKIKDYEFRININKKDLNTAEINITLPDDAKGNATVIVNDKEFSAVVENGKIGVTADNIIIGSNNIEVIYNGDEKYDLANKSEVFNGDKKESFVQISAANIKLGQDAVIIITLPDDATGSVLINVGEKDYLREITNGRVILTIPNLVIGSYDVSVDYLGDGIYLNSENTSSFKVNTNVVESFIMISVDASGKITGILKSINGYVISNAVISYTVDSEVFNITTNEKGEFTIQGIENKNYIFQFTGNDEYSQSISSITIKNTVDNRKSTYIEINSKYSSLTSDLKAGEKGNVIYATLKDSDGNVLANKSVQILVGSSVYYVSSNNQGKIAMNVNFNIAGTYTYVLSFAGDSQYNASKLVSTNVVVTKKKTTISAKNTKFNAKLKTKKYKITLKTVKNKLDGKTYLKSGNKLILTINGKTYSAKTNAKGVAIFKIKKLTKRGVYKAVITFKGDQTYKSVTKKIKLTIK